MKKGETSGSGSDGLAGIQGADDFVGKVGFLEIGRLLLRKAQVERLDGIVDVSVPSSLPAGRWRRASSRGARRGKRCSARRRAFRRLPGPFRRWEGRCPSSSRTSWRRRRRSGFFCCRKTSGGQAFLRPRGNRAWRRRSPPGAASSYPGATVCYRCPCIRPTYRGNDNRCRAYSRHPAGHRRSRVSAHRRRYVPKALRYGGS